MKTSFTVCASIATFSLLIAIPVHGGLIVDQQQTLENGVTATFTSPAQSFIPTLTSLNFVELGLEDRDPDNSIGANLFVQIRQTSITGTIIGTSSTLSLSDGFGAPVGSGLTPVLFTFPSLVSLTPSNTYVLQLFISSGDTFLVNTSDSNPYSGGTAFFFGSPFSDSDLYFREGILSAVPEPSTALFGVIGILGLQLRRIRNGRNG